MNHVLIVDDLLTEEECDTIINSSSSYMVTHGKPQNYNISNAVISSSTMEKINHRLVEQYSKKFPECNFTTEKWVMLPFTFKQFIPGNAFEDWHCEHSTTYPHRVACILVYLSDHDCGTEFYNGEVVKSKKGRAVMFPTFWTHTHRGQVCPERKNRYIMSAYLNLEDKQ